MSAPTADRPSAKPAIDEEELFREDLTPLIRGTALGARTLARCITRVHVEGDASAIPRTGPVILCRWARTHRRRRDCAYGPNG